MRHDLRTTSSDRQTCESIRRQRVDRSILAAPHALPEVLPRADEVPDCPRICDRAMRRGLLPACSTPARTTFLRSWQIASYPISEIRGELASGIRQSENIFLSWDI